MYEKHWLDRQKALIGEKGIEYLSSAHIIVFGLGGVGGYAAETLARAGIGELSLVDKDVFDVTNLNRQLLALKSTIGKSKCEVAKNRLLDINSELKINTYPMFFNEEALDKVDFSSVTYCIDAIDVMTSKVTLIKHCQRNNIPIISCMGTGFRIDPSKLFIGDIYETTVCPMAKSMRALCKRAKIDSLRVVYSREKPMKPLIKDIDAGEKRAVIGSMSFVPATAGILLANTVVRDILMI